MLIVEHSGLAVNKNVVIEESEAGTPQARRIAATLAEARNAGLLGGKTARIGVRVSPELLQAARDSTGLKTDSEVMEYALASLAVDGNYGATLRKIRGTVDPKSQLGR